MPTEKPRFTITMEESLFQKVENFRFDGHYKNQTKAVTVLIEKGLEVLAAEDPEIAKVIKHASLNSSEAEKLAQDYDGLDVFGKKAVRAVADVEKSRCEELAAADRRSMIRAAARSGGVTEIEEISLDEVSGGGDIP